MKGLIQEYGLLLVGISAILICLIFGKQVFQQNIKETVAENVFDLKHANDQGSFKYNNLTFDKDTKEYIINTPGKGFNTPGWWGDKYHNIILNGLEIPYGKWYVIEFEIMSPKSFNYILDINNKVVRASDWNGNDNDNIDKRFEQTGRANANEWKKIRAYYQNSNSKNTEKRSLIDISEIYVKYDNDNGNEFFKVRNFRTYVSSNPNRY